MAHGVNANLLRRWVRAAELRLPNIGPNKPAAAREVQAPETKTLFVPLSLPPRRANPAGPHPHRAEARRDGGHGDLAGQRRQRVRHLAARAAAMIRIDATAIDMRAGPERLLARVVQVFSAAQAHHGYLFANGRGTRIKLPTQLNSRIEELLPHRRCPAGTEGQTT